MTSMRELEQRLEAAAAYYPFPATPDLAGVARARLTVRRTRSRARDRARLRGRARRVAGAVLALSPGARSGVADLLDRVPGIHIERRVSLPDAEYVEPPYYGIEMPPEEAAGHFGRPLRFPKGVGDPDHVYWLQYPPGDMVTAVFGGDDRRAKLVFSQWKTGGPDLFYKMLFWNTTAENAVVDGSPGIWIPGATTASCSSRPRTRGPDAKHWRSAATSRGTCSPGATAT